MKWLSSLFLVAAVSVSGYELLASLAQPQVILHEPRLAALFMLGGGLVLLLIWSLMEEAGWGFLLVNLGMLGELGFLISGYRMVRGEVVLQVSDRFILAAAGVLVFALLNLFLAFRELHAGVGGAPPPPRPKEKAAPAPVSPPPAGVASSPSPGETAFPGQVSPPTAESPAGEPAAHKAEGPAQAVRRGLSVVAGEQAGSFFPLTGEGPWRLGRGEGVEIRLNDPRVSRLHAEFSLSPVGLEIRDLGSTNGTYVNGSRISEARLLADGDLIEVGDSGLRVVMPEGDKGSA